jgi:intein/homing endonuclease
VLSFDPATGKMVANEVGELITASGRQIRATAEHPMWVGEKTSLIKKIKNSLGLDKWSLVL